MTYALYWIHDGASDPMSEGYIGITKQSLDARFAQHRCNRKNHHLRNRCRKDVTIVALHEGLTREAAIAMERSYRPMSNVGWNMAPGGDIPPPQTGRKYGKNFLSGGDRTAAQKAADAINPMLQKGRTPHNKRTVVVNGVAYKSVTEARRQLRVGYERLMSMVEK